MADNVISHGMIDGRVSPEEMFTQFDWWEVVDDNVYGDRLIHTARAKCQNVQLLKTVLDAPTAFWQDYHQL